ncbi:DUF3515 domain-containing protein [Nocardia yamanashiensis]|uniref:DUF3515 domain-containing protein n=1 Tax=Nocardia yamanashiensis TaxID=209247 RepID=UPI001E557CC2|nr:DUF3515 domain-containing protein [Nocardia yamanashiensis]UGT42042.1 DUF3515 domain-containing protein [Nocardia yamanashiensis]
MSNDTRGSELDSTQPDAAASAAEPSGVDAGTAAPASDSTAATGSRETGTAASDSTVGLEKKAPAAAESDAAASEATESPAEAEYSPGRSPALIATAIALPVALVVGVLVMGVLANRNPAREPLALGSIPAPAATGPACGALLPALPEKIGDYTQAELRAPAPEGTKAWQLPDGGEPIVLRCGLDRPLEFNRASPLQVVNGVSWFEIRDQTTGVTSGTWWAVDRGTYLALTQPDNAGPTPLQEVSDAIKKAMPEQPLDPNPLPN